MPKGNPNPEPHLENLRLFEPGKSGNPAGKAKGTVSITAALKRYLRDHPAEVDKVVVALVKHAQSGNAQILKELLDRIDGRVVERHHLEGDLPITLQFVPAGQLISPAPEALPEGPKPVDIMNNILPAEEVESGRESVSSNP